MDYIQIIGFVSAVLTTAANFPQAVKIIRTGSTKSISTATYALLFTGLSLWLTYGILREDWPLILANGISALLAGTILVLKIIAKRKETRNTDFPV